MSDYREHPEFLALLHAADENPREDLPWLALADWLAEQGYFEAEEFFRSGRGQEVHLIARRQQEIYQEIAAMPPTMESMASMRALLGESARLSIRLAKLVQNPPVEGDQRPQE